MVPYYSSPDSYKIITQFDFMLVFLFLLIKIINNFQCYNIAYIQNDIREYELFTHFIGMASIQWDTDMVYKVPDPAGYTITQYSDFVEVIYWMYVHDHQSYLLHVTNSYTPFFLFLLLVQDS